MKRDHCTNQCWHPYQLSPFPAMTTTDKTGAAKSKTAGQTATSAQAPGASKKAAAADDSKAETSSSASTGASSLIAESCPLDASKPPSWFKNLSAKDRKLDWQYYNFSQPPAFNKDGSVRAYPKRAWAEANKYPMTKVFAEFFDEHKLDAGSNVTIGAGWLPVVSKGVAKLIKVRTRCFQSVCSPLLDCRLVGIARFPAYASCLS